MRISRFFLMASGVVALLASAAETAAAQVARASRGAPQGPVAGGIRDEMTKNGVTVRVLQSDCADGRSPLQVVADDPAALPATHLVTNTIASVTGRMTIYCMKAMNVYDVPVVSAAGVQLSDGYIYTRTAGWIMGMKKDGLTGDLEKWFRQNPSVNGQYVYILSGGFAENPVNLTGKSPMAQIIYSFSRFDAQNCADLVGNTTEMAWKSYYRHGTFVHRNGGSFDVDSDLAPIVSAIFNEGNRPGSAVNDFSRRLFWTYDCDAPEMQRVRDAIAQQALVMYGES